MKAKYKGFTSLMNDDVKLTKEIIEEHNRINKEYFEECAVIDKAINDTCSTCSNSKRIFRLHYGFGDEGYIKCAKGYTCRDNGYCKFKQDKE